MSKLLSKALRAHYTQRLQTLTCCVRITRQDGVVIGLTEHDQPLILEGVVYHSGYTPTAVQCNDTLSVNTVEIEGLLAIAGVKARELAAGLFDHARIDIFEVNYTDLTQGTLPLLSGFWGATTWQGHRYTTEFRSLAQTLQQPFGELYSKTCRAQLGDTRCRVNLAAFTHSGVVREVAALDQFQADDFPQAAGYFAHAMLTWQSGHNAGQCVEIQTFEAKGLFQLVEPMARAIQQGDAFSAIAGCDKRLTTCHTLFNNVANFRGEPFVPDLEQLRLTL